MSVRARTECPVCHETVSYSMAYTAGHIGPNLVIFRKHGPRDNPCPGSRQRWTEREVWGERP